MEFWNDVATDKSWSVLNSLSKRYDFVLIGGWAIYLLTKQVKSKDIDIIIEPKVLWKMKSSLGVKKTGFLKKYEAGVEEISIDIYVKHYSEFILPVDNIVENVKNIAGHNVPEPYIMIILKQEAEKSRRNSVKGQKDRVDILSLLVEAGINWNGYRTLCKKYCPKYPRELKNLISSAKKEFSYLGIENPRKIKLIKKKIKEKLRFS